MAYAATAGGSLPSMTAAPGVLALQRTLVWLAGASIAIVFIEPSPYEIVTLLATVIFFATGLRMRLVFIPLVLLLFLINIGYTISSVAVFDRPNVPNWIMTSWYMAITVVLFAMVISEDTTARLDMLRRGLVVGAVIASLAGIAGYFNLVPGGRDLLTLYDRARGTFKDPNVLGAFLILPAVLALQSVVTERFGKSLRSAIAFGIISLAILLSFSRAAWGQLIIVSGFMLVLMVLTSRSQAQRSRIIMTALVAVVLAVALVAVLLSLSSVADLFKQRASFDQSYDTGRFGRFGRHVLGAEMALGLPLRHRAAAVQPLFPGRYPQFLFERIHVGRLARRRLLSGARLRHRADGVPLCLRPRTVAAGLYRDLHCLRRHRRRKLHHRYRPLAALLDDAGHHVGHVRRRRTLEGRRQSGTHSAREGFLGPLAFPGRLLLRLSRLRFLGRFDHRLEFLGR